MIIVNLSPPDEIFRRQTLHMINSICNRNTGDITLHIYYNLIITYTSLVGVRLG